MYDEQHAYLDIVETSAQLADSRAQLESLLDASDALESLRGHLEMYSVTTEAHRTAVVASLENLALSTGLGPYDLLPSLEGHVDGYVSTESLSDRLAALWKRIVDAIYATLRFLKSLWIRIATYRGHLRLSSDTLKKRAAVKRGSIIKTPTIEFKSNARHLSIAGKVVTEPDAVLRNYITMVDQYDTFSTIWGKEMINVGKSFASALNEGRPSDETLDRTLTVFEGMPLGKVGARLNARLYRDNRFGRRLALAAPPVLGGHTLFFLTLDKAQSQTRETEPLSYAAALRTTGVRFVVTTPGIQVNTGTVGTASAIQVESLATEAIKALDLIEDYEKSGMFKKIESQITAVLKAGESYQTKVDSGPGTAAESTLRFARNYATWANGPVDQMATNILSVTRTILSYGHRSLAATNR